jgi:segregation and condensation protein B
MQVAGGWQLATRPEYGLWVRKLYHNKMTVRLTQAALETLCIIAYKQPLTRAEIEAVRGVEVIGPLDTLTQRKLVTVVGRRESIGRPILYGTTSEFLRQFGLNSLDDMPKLESFNIDNMAAAAQSTAVELIEQETEPVAEGAPPADPMSEDALAAEAAATAEAGPETAPAAEPSEASEAAQAAETDASVPVADAEEAAAVVNAFEAVEEPEAVAAAGEPAAEAAAAGQSAEETGEKPL